MGKSWLIGYAELKVHGNSCFFININHHELATIFS